MIIIIIIIIMNIITILIIIVYTKIYVRTFIKVITLLLVIKRKMHAKSSWNYDNIVCSSAVMCMTFFLHL